MRVHHACGHLDQLSGVPDQQDLGIAAVRRMVERLTDEVGALDRAFKVKAKRVPREIRAVVARTQERNALSLRVQAVQFQSDGVHERLFAHRLNDAARAEDRDAADDAEVPVVGLGGVEKWQDAIEMMLAGATGVQVGTAMFYDPYAPLKIIEGMNEWLDRNGIADVGEIIGQVRPW